MDSLEWLQNWYLSNCDGDWEHSYGIKIDTLDNPGWYIEINLIDTHFEDKDFCPIKINRSEHDWIDCKIKDNNFIGAGGPNNLIEIINEFKNWTESVF